MTIPYVLMRMPIIFILDEFFKRDFDMMGVTSMFDEKNEYINGTAWQINSAEFAQSLYGNVLLPLIKILVCCTIYWSFLFLIALPKEFLEIAYGHVVVVCFVLLSFWLNLEALELLSEKCAIIKENVKDKAMWDIIAMVEFLTEPLFSEFVFIMFRNIMIQYFLSQVMDWFVFHYFIDDFLCTCFWFPVFFVFIPTTQKSLNLLYVLISYLPMLRLLFINIHDAVTCLIDNAFQFLMSDIKNRGIFLTITKEWKRNKLPNALQLFWAMRVIYQYLYLMPDMKTISETIQFLLVNGCDTFISFSGMVFFFSSVLKFFEECMTEVLFVDHIEIKSLNGVFIILFYIMACQTGLLYLEPEERFTQLCQNFYLLCSILPVYIHNINRPLLTYSTYFDNNSLKWHPGALLVCGSFSMYSLKLLLKVLKTNPISLWLLVVSFFNCQTNMHLLVSLIIYLLNLSNCLRFDDYVKYSKIFGSIMNFSFIIFFLLAGVYIMVFEPFGVVRAIMICIHMSQAGTQLVDDVCTMFSKLAKITKRNHYFHSIYLLLVQHTSNLLLN